ncbi:hypothetical protein RYX36_020032, partial [Vicia faba]
IYNNNNNSVKLFVFGDSYVDTGNTMRSRSINHLMESHFMAMKARQRLFDVQFSAENRLV